MRTPENIVVVVESVCASIHRRSQQPNLPYKEQLVQELRPIGHTMRFRFAKWAFDRLTEDTDFGKKNHFSDEAHFDLGEYAKQAKLSHLRHRKPARMH